MMIDYISGDDDPDDPELNTFNALFPRGRYFVAQGGTIMDIDELRTFVEVADTI